VVEIEIVSFVEGCAEVDGELEIEMALGVHCRFQLEKQVRY